MGLTDYEYQILNEPITQCSIENSIDNENGTYTIFQNLNRNIPAGGLKIRKRAMNGNPASIWLVSNSSFTLSSPLDTTVLSPSEMTSLLFDGDFSSNLNTVVDGKVAVLKNLNGTLADLSQSNPAARPLLISEGGLNNLPYADFQSTAKLSLSSINVPVPFTIFIVLKQKSFTEGGIVVDFGDGFTQGIVQKNIESVNSLSIVNNVVWVPKSTKYYNNEYMVFCAEIKSSWPSIQKDKLPKDNNLTQNFGSSPITTLSIGGGANFDIQYLCLFSGTPTPLENLRLTNFFREKFQFVDKPYLLSFGDSITAGSNATSGNSYAELVSMGLSAELCNKGISGSSVFGSGDTDLINIYEDLDFLKTNTGYLSFCFGTNDAWPIDAEWKSTYKSIIQYFVDYGFSKNKIIIISPPYQSNKESKLEIVLVYIQEIANELGVLIADCFTHMKNNGGDSLLTDGTHPSDAGHAMMANVVLDQIQNQ